MPTRHYILAEERDAMLRDAILQAISAIGGVVAIRDNWPGDNPPLSFTDEALQARSQFCRLVMLESDRKEKCLQSYEERTSEANTSAVSLCWCGAHNAISVIKNEHGDQVSLIGGEFRLQEEQAEASERLDQLLTLIPADQHEAVRTAWSQLPEMRMTQAHAYVIRELAAAGRNYIAAVRQLSDFRYRADQTTHDVVIALQALIADIEVLKIELKDAFGIGSKWEKRFEALIKLCEEHNTSLETRLDLDKPKYSYYSINKLIHECARLYTPKAKAKNIDIRIDLESDVDENGKYRVLAVRMDLVNLRQALRNVIDNAVKYSFAGTAEGPRRVEIRGKLEAMRRIPGYSIAISNLGVGIEEDELQRVFEVGYQGRRRLEESRSGHGIGLPVVRDCVEQHGGKITLTSQPQQRTGWLTTVKIWLPLQGPSAAGPVGKKD